MLSRVLLVSASEKGVDALSSLLDNQKYSPVSVARSRAEALSITASQRFDIIIINAPLPEEFGADFAAAKALELNCSVIMVAAADICDKVRARISRYGVFVTPKPLDRRHFADCLALSDAMTARCRALEEQNEQLREKLSEIKLVERAKNILIECLKMTEPQAHRYLEKQAMDMRVTKKQAASSVIKTYTDSY